MGVKSHGSGGHERLQLKHVRLDQIGFFIVLRGAQQSEIRAGAGVSQG